MKLPDGSRTPINVLPTVERNATLMDLIGYNVDCRRISASGLSRID
jgi:hypothetical protein